MDSLFHFLFVFLLLLAARIHLTHHRFAPLFLSVLTLVPDADHYFGLIARASLHNVFVTVLFPLVLLGIAFLFEKKGVFFKQLALLVLVCLLVHPILDLPGDIGVQFLYPLSDQAFALGNLGIFVPIQTGQLVPLVSSTSIAIVLALVLMLPVFFLEQIIGKIENTEEAKNGVLGTA